MITFDDVRRTQEKTFTFAPDGMADELTHFLTAAGITEQQYEILSYSEAKTRYPDLDIPPVPMDPRLASVPSTYCKKPNVVISMMNPDDLQRKIYEIHLSPEGQAWQDEQLRRYLEARDSDEETNGP